MKLIKLKQAKIDGEDSPKVVELETVFLNPESVDLIHDCLDKYDTLIKGVCQVCIKSGCRLILLGSSAQVVKEIEEQSLVP